MAGWIERWDTRNQERIEAANRRYGDRPMGADDSPGPAWAYGLAFVSVLHWIGDAVIAIDAWRRRGRKDDDA